METKKKRTKCETSSRHTIILNSLNPREKVIFDFLSNQYNKSDSVKDIVYEYIITNNLQVNIQPIISKDEVNSNKVISSLSNEDKYNTSDNTVIENTVISECVQDDNMQQSKDTSNDNDFNIDLDNIEDEEVKVDTGKDNKDATKNAMNYLLSM